MVSGQNKNYRVVNCAVSHTLSAFSDCAFVSVCQAFVQEKKGIFFPSPNWNSVCFSSICKEKLENQLEHS